VSTRVVLVDSGGSNLSSVQAAFARLGVDAELTAHWDDIAAASHVVLPGVGAAGPAMARLRGHHLVDKLATLKQPVLGVCVGIQLMFSHSQEGDIECTNLIPGVVCRLPQSTTLRVPHMGWNRIDVHQAHPLVAGLDGKFAYYVHSFAADFSDPLTGGYSIASSLHGVRFSAVVARDNFMGAQFHPERSQEVGARLLKNFLELR
jgi:imidazole glycerol-phosphate synthase subunit HisH